MKATLRAAGIGMLSGALVFVGLRHLGAQTVLRVADFHRNSKAYVGTTIQVTGVAGSVKLENKKVGSDNVPYAKFCLYEQDSKGKKTKYYIWVSIPAESFQNPPKEGDDVTITGLAQWPDQIAKIEP
jgi:hypothetical protein